MNTNYTLPAEHIKQIASYLPLNALDAFSRTCWNVRRHCSLIELYKSSLETLIGLQERFIFRCKYSEIVGPNNVFVSTLKENSIQLEGHSKKEFECHASYFIERNEYFTTPDTNGIQLAEKQFIVAVRLGNPSIKDVEYKNLSDRIFRSFNPDTSDLVRTTTFPIKEIRCDLGRTVGISFDEATAIQAAAKTASQPKLTS